MCTVKRMSTENLVMQSTIILIVVSGFALLMCNVFEHENAEYHFYMFEPVKYCLLKFCYSIIAISFAFNCRYLISLNFKQFADKAKKTLAKRDKKILLATKK
jgi:hypothetical protein